MVDLVRIESIGVQRVLAGGDRHARTRNRRQDEAFRLAMRTVADDRFLGKLALHLDPDRTAMTLCLISHGHPFLAPVRRLTRRRWLITSFATRRSPARPGRTRRRASW